jgi:predicted alpha/beta superfamily hydrolase
MKVNRIKKRASRQAKYRFVYVYSWWWRNSIFFKSKQNKIEPKLLHKKISNFFICCCNSENKLHQRSIEKENEMNGNYIENKEWEKKKTLLLVLLPRYIRNSLQKRSVVFFCVAVLLLLLLLYNIYKKRKLISKWEREKGSRNSKQP